MSGFKLAAAALLAASLTGGAALAQISTSNPNAPIDVSADESEVSTDSCKTIFRGDAEALQDKTRLRAHSITAYAAKTAKGCGDATRLEADGDVYYVTPDQVVRGDHAVYSTAARTIVVTGNVIVVQGKNVARGERLTVQIATGAATMEGPKGRGTPGRVRAVVFPDQSQKQ
jgi:lipopolysaccharide export system protein LptA